MKKSLLFLFLPFLIFSQAPPAYYNSSAGLSGYKLKSALHNIISDKTYSCSYTEVGTFYPQTDADKYYENDNTILDIYSENPTGPDAYNYNFNQNISTASAEGQGWNKEHMMPQSTFYSNYPMQSDLNYLVPADARINQLRNNYPYGKGNSTVHYKFTNGSQINDNATPNAVYTGRVYEPIDEFKGDVARSLLYFAVRYEGKLSTFKFATDLSPVKDRNPLNGTEEQAYDKSFIDLMMVWNTQDPVSQREIDRNNAIFGIQKNRNPFIDHPEWINLIWSQTVSSVDALAPTMLIASKISAYFVNLSWTAPTDPSILGYKVYLDNVLVGSTKNNFLSIDHLNPATNYNLSVKSYNNTYVQSAESNILSVLTYTTDIYAKDLIISKYLEGTGDNKALEITNKTGHEVNLSPYTLTAQFKRDATNYYLEDMQLEGTVADNATFVVMNARSAFTCYTPTQAKFSSTAPQVIFDGSNYLSLGYNAAVVDAIGKKYANNFSDLGDVSLYRLATVTAPNSTFNIAEWEKKPVDYCDNLGNLGISESSEAVNNKLSIYPNPVTESQIFVRSLNLKQFNSAQVFDVSGKLLISEKRPFVNKNYINVVQLKKGIYILKIDSQSFKIIKK